MEFTAKITGGYLSEIPTKLDMLRNYKGFTPIAHLHKIQRTFIHDLLCASSGDLQTVVIRVTGAYGIGQVDRAVDRQSAKAVPSIRAAPILRLSLRTDRHLDCHIMQVRGGTNEPLRLFINQIIHG